MKRKVIVGITFVLLLISVILIVIGLNLKFTVKDDTDSDEGNTNISGDFNSVGTWYVIYDFNTYEVNLNEDGTFNSTNVDYGDKSKEGTYKYIEETNKFIITEKITFSKREEYKTYDYTVVSADNNMFKIRKDSDTGVEDYLLFFSNKDKCYGYDSQCTNPDSEGFCIKNGELISYIGNKEEVIIPESVHIIKSNSFAGDYNRAIYTKKVTIPGTVKTVEGNAFAFSRVKNVIIEEGVETIGGLFMDTCPTYLDFPKSIKTVGGSMMSSEEICNGPLKIYLYKDSEMDKYFKLYKPDCYDYEIIYK